MFETVGEPRRVDGLALLACTAAAAALIVLLVIGRPADSVFPAIYFIGLAAFYWNRRRR